MRFKVVPPVRDVGFLREVADAVPLVPGREDDCCTRIRDRTAVPARDAAREWLTFCQALGLVTETDGGYHRVQDEPDRDALAAAYRERIFGVREVLQAVSERDGTTPAAAFEEIRDDVPQWERARDDDWAAAWRERTGRLLGWAAVFDLVERDGDVFRPPPG
jgi:hypothetical protein